MITYCLAYIYKFYTQLACFESVLYVQFKPNQKWKCLHWKQTLASVKSFPLFLLKGILVSNWTVAAMKLIYQVYCGRKHGINGWNHWLTPPPQSIIHNYLFSWRGELKVRSHDKIFHPTLIVYGLAQVGQLLRCKPVSRKFFQRGGRGVQGIILFSRGGAWVLFFNMQVVTQYDKNLFYYNYDVVTGTSVTEWEK